VVRWEYCKIIDPLKLVGRPTESAKLVYLGASKDEEEVVEIETPEHALARLGAEGWELVDHTQLFTVIENSGALPVMEVYYLKRAIAEALG
jgi:hypothetical protein